MNNEDLLNAAGRRDGASWREMTKRAFALVACAVPLALWVTWPGTSALASSKLNFSGKYSLQGQKATRESQGDVTLEVTQSEDAVDVSRVEGGRRTTNRYPLDGSEGEYTSPGGVQGKCKAQLKGESLVLDSEVVTRPQSSATPVRVHTRERWRLSADSKTLTIRTDVDFPGAPAGVSAALDLSTTEKFTRTDGP